MLYPTLAILFGLIILVWSADRFVEGAASIAQGMGVTKLMVGLTIVSLGTSAPEILVSAFASYAGSPHLAIGNVLGSNIANIGLVLGVTAAVVSIPVHRISMKEDLPFYLLVLLVSTFLMLDNQLQPIDGLIFATMLLIFITLLVKLRAKVKEPSILQEFEEESHDLPTGKAVFWFLVGLILLISSSRVLVWGAVEYARHFEVSEVIIGLTIIAIGTSLPELAATLTSALKGHHDLAIGNIIGSNILNLVAVMPFPALLAPGLLAESTLTRDLPFMIAMSLLLAFFTYTPKPWFSKKGRKRGVITRPEGAFLLLLYFGYLTWLGVNLS
jgi:cation:H+ antiporter